jgi:hypothetical protein
MPTVSHPEDETIDVDELLDGQLNAHTGSLEPPETVAGRREVDTLEGAARQAPIRAVRYVPSVSETPYRVPAPTPADPYLVAWAQLRDRRRHLQVASPPFLIGTAVASVMLLGRSWWAVLFPLWVAWSWVTAAYLGGFHCPRCDEPWKGNKQSRQLFRGSCAKCGLEVDTPKDPTR